MMMGSNNHKNNSIGDNDDNKSNVTSSSLMQSVIGDDNISIDECMVLLSIHGGDAQLAIASYYDNHDSNKNHVSSSSKMITVRMDNDTNNSIEFNVVFDRIVIQDDHHNNTKLYKNDVIVSLTDCKNNTYRQTDDIVKQLKLFNTQDSFHIELSIRRSITSTQEHNTSISPDNNSDSNNTIFDKAFNSQETIKEDCEIESIFTDVMSPSFKYKECFIPSILLSYLNNNSSTSSNRKTIEIQCLTSSLGMTVENIQECTIIVSVKPDGVCAKAGIRSKDWIVGVNGISIVNNSESCLTHHETLQLISSCKSDSSSSSPLILEVIHIEDPYIITTLRENLSRTISTNNNSCSRDDSIKAFKNRWYPLYDDDNIESLNNITVLSTFLSSVSSLRVLLYFISNIVLVDISPERWNSVLQIVQKLKTLVCKEELRNVLNWWITCLGKTSSSRPKTLCLFCAIVSRDVNDIPLHSYYKVIWRSAIHRMLSNNNANPMVSRAAIFVLKTNTILFKYSIPWIFSTLEDCIKKNDVNTDFAIETFTSICLTTTASSALEEENDIKLIRCRILPIVTNVMSVKSSSRSTAVLRELPYLIYALGSTLSDVLVDLYLEYLNSDHHHASSSHNEVVLLTAAVSVAYPILFVLHREDDRTRVMTKEVLQSEWTMMTRALNVVSSPSTSFSSCPAILQSLTTLLVKIINDTTRKTKPSSSSDSTLITLGKTIIKTLCQVCHIIGKTNIDSFIIPAFTMILLLEEDSSKKAVSHQINLAVYAYKAECCYYMSHQTSSSYFDDHLNSLWLSSVKELLHLPLIKDNLPWRYRLRALESILQTTFTKGNDNTSLELLSMIVLSKEKNLLLHDPVAHIRYTSAKVVAHLLKSISNDDDTVKNVIVSYDSCSYQSKMSILYMIECIYSSTQHHHHRLEECIGLVTDVVTSKKSNFNLRWQATRAIGAIYRRSNQNELLRNILSDLSNSTSDDIRQTALGYL